MTHDTFPVDQERTSQRNMIWMAYPIRIHHFPTQIRYQGDIDRADTALGYRCITPGIMREMRVHRHADDFDVTALKIFRPVRVGNDFRRANESKIQWIKKQYCIFVANMRMKIKIFVETAIRDRKSVV